MRCRVAVIGVLAACSDPSLRIAVIPVDGLGATATTVAVYQSATLLCDDVEYGVADAQTLEGALVAEAVVEAGEPLVGVSRVEPKVIVATGRDATGRAVFAGCEQRGEITDDEVVTITTSSVATTTISGDAVDRPFAHRQIRVLAVDALGRPLDQRRVRWQSYGVAGSFPPLGSATSAPDRCTHAGVATVEPADPDTAGPIAAQIRVAWAEVTPAPLSGFVANATNQVDLREGTAIARRPASCAVRREGPARADHVYCLTRPPQAVDTRQVVELDLTGDQLGATAVGGRVAGDHLVATQRDTGDDALYVVAKAGALVQFTGLAGTPDGDTFDPCTLVSGACDLQALRQVVVVPSCGAAPGFIGISFATGTELDPDDLVLTDLAGVPLPDQPPAQGAARVDLLAGGCVAEHVSGGPVRQALAARITPIAPGQSPYNIVLARCDTGGVCSARWPGFGAVGFSGGATPRLLSSEIDITGNVIVESELIVVGGDHLELIEVGRTPTTAQARSIVSADVDGDAIEDLAWSQFVTDDLGATANRVEVAVGRAGLPFPGRLAGLSPALPGGLAQLLFADIDDDAAPDLVSFSDGEAAVYRSGVPVPPDPPAGEETTCD